MCMQKPNCIYQIIIILSLYSTAIFSQNRHFEVNFTVPTYAQAVIDNKDQGFIFSGAIQATATQSVAFIASIDKNGQWTWGKQVKEPDRYTDFSRIIKLSDGNYLAGGNIYENAQNPSAKILLTKFNEQGDILWNKSVGGSTAVGEIKFVDFIENNKNIIILGYADERNSGCAVLAVNINGTDADDKIVTFGGEEMDVPKNILSDGTNYLVSGVTTAFSQDKNADVFISTLHADFSIDKNLVISQPGHQHTSAFCIHQGQYYLGMDNNNPPYTQLVKIDPNFKVNWSIKFPSHFLRGIGGLNKSILLIDSWGGLYKLSENGDLLKGLSFYRTGSISLGGYSLTSSGYSVLAGSKTIDGPIVLIRQNADLLSNCEAYNYLPETSKEAPVLTSRPWPVVSTLKSTLANAKNTWTTLTLNSSSVCNTTAVEEQTTNTPRIFPNPFTDVLTVDVPQSWIPGHVAVYNLQGQLVQHVDFIAWKEIKVVQHLPPGIYFLKFTSPFHHSTVKVQKAGRL